ncbi:MAG: glycosidase [Candidatus Firestonebacteria bacterium RIFOXYA2_FULL_40_8]|nr:MAG: glycosidase [Candidatus Firestonebacteria bacterium RIFOXYA2_FULL_40_8]
MKITGVTPIMKRYSENPILTSKDIPYASTMVYNPGVVKFKGKYVMVFRNDCFKNKKYHHTDLALAFSHNGIKFKVENKPLSFMRDGGYPGFASGAYDPRLTVIKGRCYLCFALDTFNGIRGGIAVTDDFKKFELLSLSLPDNRNMVLFPEKINNRFVRLERPFPVYGMYGKFKEKFDIWLSESPDGRYWGESRLVLGADKVKFSNAKIGPGTPPVKTKKGWLTIFHAVDIDENRKKCGWAGNWKKRYTAGVMLLDLKDPSKVIGISKTPLMVPQLPYEYETKGCRDNVIFPTGIILEEDGSVKIYYGAADTVIALATADINDLLNRCKPI